LSAESFEQFFEGELSLDAESFVAGYRNDWSWGYCRALAARGIDPVVYVASTRRSGLERTPDGFAVRFLPIGRAYEPWVRVPALKRSPPGRFVAQGVNAATLLAPLRRGMDEDDVDVLFVQEYWTGRYDLLASRLDVPLIAVDQGMNDRREVKLLKRRTLQRAAWVITQTGAESEKVRRYGGRAVTVPNGIDTDHFAPAPDAEREPGLIVCAARLDDSQKRQSDLIRALALLDEPWRLELIGTGPDEARLRELARELGVGGRVTFTGFLHDKDAVRASFRRCSVFALVSAFEGLPLALLEAMSCGSPAVGSDIPAIAEVIEDGVSGSIVPQGSPERIAEAIAAVGARSEQYSQAARKSIVRRFGAERMGEELERLVRDARSRATNHGGS
jgi:glycosyltransferase involved in cell wall biosynthesis